MAVISDYPEREPYEFSLGNRISQSAVRDVVHAQNYAETHYTTTARWSDIAGLALDTGDILVGEIWIERSTATVHVYCAHTGSTSPSVRVGGTNWTPAASGDSTSFVAPASGWVEWAVNGGASGFLFEVSVRVTNG